MNEKHSYELGKTHALFELTLIAVFTVLYILLIQQYINNLNILVVIALILVWFCIFLLLGGKHITHYQICHFGEKELTLKNIAAKVIIIPYKDIKSAEVKMEPAPFSRYLLLSATPIGIIVIRYDGSKEANLYASDYNKGQLDDFMKDLKKKLKK